MMVPLSILGMNGLQPVPNAVSKIRDFLTVNTNLAYVRTGSHGGGNMRSYALTVPTMDHLDEMVI